MNQDSYPAYPKAKIASVRPPKDEQELSRVLPRQISTGRARGIQIIGIGNTNPDRLDSPNGKIVVSVPESYLDLTDNTTANVSTSKHGFVPKAPNDTAQFLRGDAAWASVTYSTFSPSATGYAGASTVTFARYVQFGKIVTMDISVTGTSNATTLTFTLPVMAKTAAQYPIMATDNSTVLTTPGLLVLVAGSTTATLYVDFASTAWTNVNTKAFTACGITYEAN